jgi:hypothetical protein
MSSVPSIFQLALAFQTSKRVLLALPLATALLLNVMEKSRATIIVLVRNPEEVALAADSKLTYRGNNKPSTEGAACKIYQVGQAYFGVAGLINTSDSEYDAPTVIARELRGNSGIVTAARAAGETLKVKLLAQLPKMERLYPAGYEAVRKDPQAVSFVIAAMDGGVPTGIQIAVDFSGAEAVVRDKVLSGGPQKFMAIGSPKAIRRVRSLPTFKSASDLAIALVQHEIDSGNQVVGPPINAVTVRADGATWKRQELGCPIPK